MVNTDPTETHHGVLLNISGQGVFIIGEPGIGKSSLALECLHQGHQLIADDVVEFTYHDDHIIGHCPTLLSDLLHTRELGLIPVTKHFGQQAWQSKYQLDIVLRLKNNAKLEQDGLKAKPTTTLICKQAVPTLILSTHNPASIIHRLQTALTLRTKNDPTESTFKSKQQHIMAAQSCSQQ